MLEAGFGGFAVEQADRFPVLLTEQGELHVVGTLRRR
jgi:hypothetical protein